MLLPSTGTLGGVLGELGNKNKVCSREDGERCDYDLIIHRGKAKICLLEEHSIFFLHFDLVVDVFWKEEKSM